MGDKFLSMLDFATRNLGKLKNCNFYGNDYASIDLITPEGKTLKISMTIEEEKTNA